MVAEVVADLVEGTGLEPEAVLAGLEAAGYMEKVRVDSDGDVWWDTTIQGITRTSDTFETIYSIDADPGAVAPPADRSLIGR